MNISIVAFLGLITLISLLATATTGYLMSKGSQIVTIRVHKTVAIITVILAIVHGLVAFLTFF